MFLVSFFDISQGARSPAVRACDLRRSRVQSPWAPFDIETTLQPWDHKLYWLRAGRPRCLQGGTRNCSYRRIYSEVEEGEGGGGGDWPCQCNQHPIWSFLQEWIYYWIQNATMIVLTLGVCNGNEALKLFSVQSFPSSEPVLSCL